MMKEYIEEAERDLLHTYNRYQIVFDRGDGVYLYDLDGKKYLDFVAGIAVFALGYHNESYNQALKDQIDKLIHTSNYYYNVPAVEAARKIKKVSGMDRVFFTNSGAEAVEGAIKAARKYAYLKDGTTGHEIVAMNHSFHGRTMGALSVTGNPHYREAFEPGIGNIRFADMNDFDSVAAAVNDRTCAILMETVQGEGGSQIDVLHRYDLTEGCKLTSELVAKAATQLKKMNAPTFEGKYVCIIHPSVAFDLRQDPAWVAAHQYAAATELFSGEIGELHGVRFVETTEAKIFRGQDLARNSRTLTVNGKVDNASAVTFDGGTVAANALKGRYVLLGGKRCKVLSNTASQMTLDTGVTAADDTVIYPGEGGSQGCAVYGCLFLGKGAYGVVDLSEGTEVIVKPRGSSGTADPLDQRSSVGWKGIHAAAILYDEYMVRVECGSSYSGEDKAN